MFKILALATFILAFAPCAQAAWVVIGDSEMPATAQDKEVADLFARAQQGDSKAFYSLGLHYEEGWGVPKDYDTAAQMYLSSAELGYDAAQIAIANCYYIGKGVYKNYAEALNWFQKAAYQGNFKALRNLGSMYNSGKGVAQNTIKAHMLFGISYKIARQYGNPPDWYLRELLELRKQLAATMTSEQLSESSRLLREYEAVPRCARRGTCTQMSINTKE